MSESPGDVESIPSGGTPEDPQLTIRIPNPKVYIERQSQWKGAFFSLFSQVPDPYRSCATKASEGSLAAMRAENST